MPATPATSYPVCMQASPVCNEVNMELTSAQDTKCTVYFMEGVLCNMLKVFKICSCTCHYTVTTFDSCLFFLQA